MVCFVVVDVIVIVFVFVVICLSSFSLFFQTCRLSLTVFQFLVAILKRRQDLRSKGVKTNRNQMNIRGDIRIKEPKQNRANLPAASARYHDRVAPSSNEPLSKAGSAKKSQDVRASAIARLANRTPFQPDAMPVAGDTPLGPNMASHSSRTNFLLRMYGEQGRRGSMWILREERRRVNRELMVHR